jgi:hypothetical protein
MSTQTEINVNYESEEVETRFKQACAAAGAAVMAAAEEEQEWIVHLDKELKKEAEKAAAASNMALCKPTMWEPIKRSRNMEQPTAITSPTATKEEAIKAVAEACDKVTEACSTVEIASNTVADANKNTKEPSNTAEAASNAVEAASNTIADAVKSVADASNALTDAFNTVGNANKPASDMLSLYIPRIDLRAFNNIGTHVPHEKQLEDGIKLFIAKQFNYQQIGLVERVDLAYKKTPEGHGFYIAFIHFENWYNTPAAKQLRWAVLAPNHKAKFQWHEQWYWIVNENKKPLDAKTVELYETIRVQQVKMQEQITKIKTFEEEIMNPVLYAEAVRKGFMSLQPDENAKFTTLEEIHSTLGWPVA